MTKFSDLDELNIEFKPRRVADDNPFAFRKLDDRSVNVPLPKRIARKRLHIFQPEYHKTVHCNFCGMPALWFDKRIDHQWNECVQCDCIHEMIVDNWGYVKKRMVDEYPVGYIINTPFKIRRKK